MYKKDTIDKVQAVALIVLTVSTSILMLAASYACSQYNSVVDQGNYEINICSNKQAAKDDL